MKKLIEKFRSSAQEFTRPQSITIAAMLLALRVVLGYFSNFTLNFTPTIKFGFSFLPLAICGLLLGPAVGGIVGAFGDILSFILNPTGGAYFPGWTLNAALTGIIFGIFLYKAQSSPLNFLARVIISKVIITIFVELILGTLWLNISLGYPYLITLGGKVIKQLIFTPMEIVIIFFISRALNRVKILRYR